MTHSWMVHSRSTKSFMKQFWGQRANVTSITKSPMSPKKSQHDTRNEPSHVASTHALKGVNSIVTASSPNRKDLTTLHGRSYCALLAGEDIFSRQQMLLHTLRQTIWCIILKDMYNHISSRNISCPQGISVAVMRTAPLSSRVTSSRCLAAMRATCKESGLPKHGQNTEQLWQQRRWSTKNFRPGGYSDLNLQSNVYFALAGPCELQLHICKEFDQIPCSKCLKPGCWAILFWYMHALLINVFSSKGFFVQLSTSSLKQVFLLDPPPMPLLRICPNSSHIPWHDITCNIFIRSTQTT